MNTTQIKQALWTVVKNRAAAIDPIEIIGSIVSEIEGRPLSEKDRKNIVKIHRKIVGNLDKKSKKGMS